MRAWSLLPKASLDSFHICLMYISALNSYRKVRIQLNWAITNFSLFRDTIRKMLLNFGQNSAKFTIKYVSLCIKFVLNPKLKVEGKGNALF